MTHNSETLRRAFGYLFPAELPLLKSLPAMIDHSPCIVVNIGAGSGTSGLAFLESGAELTTIDVQDADSPLGCLAAERQVCTAAGYRLNQNWYQICADSKELARVWAAGPVDIVFIDGDHSYEGCAGDILGWLPHIRPGGLLAVHDYRKGNIPPTEDGPHPMPWPGVDQAVAELLLGKYELVAHVDSLIVFRVAA